MHKEHDPSVAVSGVELGGADPPTLVVGVGASAGGLEALEGLFGAAPADSNLAFVVVPHLSAEHSSRMPELLQRATPIPVVPAVGELPLRAGNVYVLLPGKQVVVRDGVLVSQDRPSDGAPFRPIDLLFHSLAPLGPRAAAVVLSGTGTDGSEGLSALHAAGGLVLAQDRSEAPFDGMIRSALETGQVDFELRLEEMLPALLDFARDPLAPRERHPPRLAPSPVEAAFQILQAAFDVDLSHYKPGTVLRRLDRRTKRDGRVLALEEYVHQLERDPDEQRALLDDVLIGVTSFYRDPGAFATLRQRALVPLIQELDVGEKLRCWVCACSTGEEAYSIAIAAMEAFEELGLPPRLRFLATDAHELALRTAGAGVYPEERLQGLPDGLREKYFHALPSGEWKVSPELRKSIIFAPHDVVRDVPFSRMDLVSCRNLLIYLRPEAQMRALRGFSSALRTGGYLFLGTSEMPASHQVELEEVDAKSRVFRKTFQARHPAQAPSLLPRRRLDPAPAHSLMAASPPANYDALLDLFVPSGILVNEHLDVLHVFGEAGRFLRARHGRFRSALVHLITPGLRTHVVTALRCCSHRSEPVTFAGVLFEEDGVEERVSILIEPILDPQDPARANYFVRLTPDEEPEARRPTLPHPAFEGHVEELEAELQRTQARLQQTIEELEATNEELIAGNEELTAANEELQSTNEELNAVNEELYVVNTEHELKIQELNEVTADLRNLIDSTGIATVFLDHDRNLRMFTPRAREIFRIRDQDVGRPLEDLTMVGADEELMADLERVSKSSAPIARELAWPADRYYLRSVSPYRDTLGNPVGLVLTYVDVTGQARLRMEIAAAEQRFRQTVESLPQLVWTTTGDGNCDYLSRQWVEYTGIPEAEQLGGGWLEQIHPDDRERLMASATQSVATGDSFEVEFRIRRADGEHRWFLTRAEALKDPEGRVVKWFGSCTDIQNERAVAATSEARFRAVYDTIPAALCDQDWTQVHARLDELLTGGVDDLRGYLAAHPAEVDVLLRLVRVVDVNPWMVHMFGATEKGELVPSLEALYTTPESRGGFVDTLCNVARGQHAIAFETRLSNVRGEPLDTMISMAFPEGEDGSLRALVSMVDITGLRIAERSSRSDRQRLQAIVDTANDSIITIDEHGLVRSANAATLAVFGYDPLEVLGMDVRMLMPGPHASQHLGYVRHYLKSGEPLVIGLGREVEGRHKDGRLFPLHLSVSEIEVAGERLFVGTARDLTQLRRTTADLLTKTAQLEQSTEVLQNTILTQQQFIYIVSHDLREPLNTITNFTQLLNEECSEDLGEDGNDYLSCVRTASDRMRALLDDLLSYVRLERAEMGVRPVDLAGLIAEVEHDLRAALEQREARLSIPRDLPVVLGQPSLLRILLQNLVDNATKFRAPETPPVVEITAEEGPGETVLYVADNGIGIPPDRCERVFEMFRRLHSQRDYPGTGIGLAMCKKIVERHSGTITLEPRTGGGTVARVTLPHLLSHATGQPHEL